MAGKEGRKEEAHAISKIARSELEAACAPFAQERPLSFAGRRKENIESAGNEDFVTIDKHTQRNGATKFDHRNRSYIFLFFKDKKGEAFDGKLIWKRRIRRRGAEKDEKRRNENVCLKT